jgi:hypoxanthine phosphoribosyltransferase
MLPPHDILYSAEAIQTRIGGLADDVAPWLGPDATVLALLQGAMPFAVDLMRALARRNVHPLLDGLWLESYRDARESSGRVVVRADVQRTLAGRRVLILDDVFDSGRTIAFARAHVQAKGATAVAACALVRKPLARGEPIEFVGFDAPDKFLVGYGMDDAGRYRGLPEIIALK